MREIFRKDIGEELNKLLNEIDPVEEDIGIIDEDGNVQGVIINERAYEFFLRKVEEEEDRIDSETVEEFNNSGEKDR